MSEATSRPVSREPVVRTVLGDIPASELGPTMTHEHLFIDLTWQPQREVPATQRLDYYAPISMSELHKIRRHHKNVDERLLLDFDTAVAEVAQFRRLGGRCIVDATSVGLGRDAAALQRVSELTGVHIVMGGGFYVSDFHPSTVRSMEESALTDMIVNDVLVGVDGTEAKVGVIGEIGMTSPVHPDEAKVLRAAAAAQGVSGAPLLIHPGRTPEAPLQHLEQVEKAGGDVSRTIVGHIDRTLFSRTERSTLASSGCYLAFDLFGRESSYHSASPIDMPNDATRIDALMQLIADGYRDQLLVSQDVCYKSGLLKYGGPGYGHILEHVVPMMRRKGMTDDDIDALLVTNPARALTLAQPK